MNINAYFFTCTCRVDENLCVKVADFGLAKDIYSSEYYRMNSHTRVPVKWMSLESLLDGFFDEKTDVVINDLMFVMQWILRYPISMLFFNI